MNIVLLCTPADTDFLDKLQRLPELFGHTLKKSTAPVTNALSLDAACDRLGIDAILCTQLATLEILLRDTTDWVKPEGRGKAITLDDYAGSMFRLKSGREVVVLNSLERLFSVPSEKFVTGRFISKLTKKQDWLPETKFQWAMVTLANQEEVLRKIDSCDLCAIDIENPYPQTEWRLMSCVSYTCYDAKTHTTESYVVPFDEIWHYDFIRRANASKSRKIFQNGLHDNSYFMRWGSPVHRWIGDTFHLFHSWLAELPRRLDFVTAFLVRDVRYWKEEGKTGRFEDLARYCAKDGWATINAWLNALHTAPQWAIDNYVNHEFPMVFPCLNAALEGMEADHERFAKIKLEKEAEVKSQLTYLQYILSEPNYNPGSWQQNERLFKLLGAGHIEGTGKIPTLKAKALHPLNDLILSSVEGYKKEAKQVGTYFNPAKFWLGRIYYSLNPGGTETLRASSSESAFDCGWQIQNIPRDDPAFKQCVLAPDGWFIAEVDKKQSEARCVAYLSGDLALINLVESEYDYHAWNASKFFGVDYAAIYEQATGKTLDKALRDLSKRTNHGANYNMGAAVMLDTMGPKKVAKAKIQLKLPPKWTLKMVCQYLLDRYVATYPDVKGRWYESIIQHVEMHGILVSPFGWVRRCFGKPREFKPHLNSLVAHPPQNLSVSIINKEWYKIWRATVYGDLRGRVRIKAQIHDSLLFIYKRVADALQVQEMMDLRVPVVGSDGVTRTLYIPTDLSLGDEPTRRWSEIK